MRVGLAFKADQKTLARTMGKQFCKFLKRDALQHMTDIGHLRSWKEYSMGVHMIAPLYGMAQYEDHKLQKTTPEFLNDTVDRVAHLRSKKHKEAIEAEMARRKEEEEARLKAERDEAAATALRRKNRMNLREKLRLHNIEKVINETVLGPINEQDWKPFVPVSDIRVYVNGSQYDS